MNFAKRLKEAREREGLSIAAAARSLDSPVHDQTWSAWERGMSTPKLGQVRDVARLLKADVLDLIP